MQDENTTYQNFQRCLIKKILVRGNRVPPKMGKVPFFLFLASSLHIHSVQVYPNRGAQDVRGLGWHRRRVRLHNAE